MVTTGETKSLIYSYMILEFRDLGFKAAVGLR